MRTFEVIEGNENGLRKEKETFCLKYVLDLVLARLLQGKKKQEMLNYCEG